jgi:hypothetical protein
MWKIIFEALKKLAKSKTTQKSALFLARGGSAIKRARDINGKLGIRMIGDSPHWVVWSDGKFIAAFPDANPKPDLDTYLRKKKPEAADVEKWLFNPVDAETAIRKFAKWRRKNGGNGSFPPNDS